MQLTMNLNRLHTVSKYLPLLALLVVVSFAVGLPQNDIPSAAAQDGPTIAFGYCPGFAANLENVDCATLTVPENRANPTGRTIDLSVVVVGASGTITRPDPIVLLDGGPGAPASRWLPVFATGNNALFSELISDRDIVLIDQRGTGNSQPDMRCPEFDLAAFNAFAQSLDPQNRRHRRC